MARNPVYQVDCSFGASGKKVAATKRRIRFRFGFSNAEALEAGATGTACRGEEHEVTLTWSLASGKRTVMADGVEVHYSKGQRAENKFETTFTMNGQHTIKLIAHAAPPLRYVPGFKQFDMQIDGLSYFNMPKIYELGVKNQNQMVPTSRVPTSRSFAEPPTYNNYSLPNECESQPEYAYNRQYYAEDRREVTSNKDVSSPTTVVDRTEPLSSPPQDLVSEPTAILGVDDLVSSPVYTIPVPTTTDEFAPIQPVEQPRSSAVVHNEILSVYGPTKTPANPGLLALTNGEQVPITPTYSPNATAYGATQGIVSPNYSTPAQNSNVPQYAPSPQYDAYPTTPQYAPAPKYNESPVETRTAVVTTPGPQTLTMSKLMDALVEEELVDEMDRALKNLVNFDDIAIETKAPEQKKKDEIRTANMNKGKSKPLPPTTPSWHLGMKPALNDIKANAPVREAPSKEVMRTHAFDPRAAQAGMMVLYGSPQIPSGGFGIPAQMQQQQRYYMYAQQQQMYAGY